MERTHVGFRLSKQAATKIDDIAHEHRVDRSLVLRMAIKTALRHQKAFDQMIEDEKKEF